jgi:probable HAF family extracellular repeat protein
MRSRILKPEIFFPVMLLGALLSAPLVQGKTAYSLTIIDTLGGSSNYASGINDRGEIVGQSQIANGDTHAFLYSGGIVKDLGTLGGNTSVGGGINNRGVAVGASEAGPGYSNPHAFVYQNGQMKDLGVLAIGPYTNNSQANSINDQGQIVGSSTFGHADRGNLPVEHAVLFDAGTIHDLGTLGGEQSFAWSINNGGQIVGSAERKNGNFHGFEYNTQSAGNVQLLDLGTLGGANSGAFSISQTGVITGTSQRANGHYHAFLYTLSVFGNGSMQDLGAIDLMSSGLCVNDQNQVVGYDTSSTGQIAILYKGGQTLINLNSYLPPGSPWVLSTATGINNHGQITGVAFLRTNPSIQRAFLLIPQ